MASAHEQWMDALTEVRALPNRCTLLRLELEQKLTEATELLGDDVTSQSRLEACRLIREVRQEAKQAAA